MARTRFATFKECPRPFGLGAVDMPTTRNGAIIHALRNVGWKLWYDKHEYRSYYDKVDPDSLVTLYPGYAWHFSWNCTDQQFELLNKMRGDCYNILNQKHIPDNCTCEEEVMYLLLLAEAIESGDLTTE